MNPNPSLGRMLMFIEIDQQPDFVKLGYPAQLPVDAQRAQFNRALDDLGLLPLPAREIRPGKTLLHAQKPIGAGVLQRLFPAFDTARHVREMEDEERWQPLWAGNPDGQEQVQQTLARLEGWPSHRYYHVAGLQPQRDSGWFVRGAGWLNPRLSLHPSGQDESLCSADAALDLVWPSRALAEQAAAQAGIASDRVEEVKYPRALEVGYQPEQGGVIVWRDASQLPNNPDAFGLLGNKLAAGFVRDHLSEFAAVAQIAPVLQALQQKVSSYTGGAQQQGCDRGQLAHQDREAFQSLWSQFIALENQIIQQTDLDSPARAELRQFAETVYGKVKVMGRDESSRPFSELCFTPYLAQQLLKEMARYTPHTPRQDAPETAESAPAMNEPEDDLFQEESAPRAPSMKF
jgi:hypothetical protein